MNDDVEAQTTNGSESRSPPDRMALTGDIVSAYIANNPVQPRDLAGLIVSVHQVLSNLGQASEHTDDPVEQPTPAQIRKSITPDGLTSFIDGKIYKTLRRHLTTHGLDAHIYRQRYGLPADYPMVSANYSATRSALAMSLGLGQIRKKTVAERAVAGETPRGRGRPRKDETAEAAE